MKILVVHNFYQDPGGEDAVFHQEVNELQKKHDVEILTFQNKKKIIGLFQFLLYPFNFFAAWKLKKKISLFKPQVIHVHNIHYASGPIIFTTAHLFKIPTVFTLHNYRLLCPSATLFYNGAVYTESVGKAFPWDAVKKGVLDNSIFKTFWTALTYKLHTWLGTWGKISLYLPLTHFAKNLIVNSTLGIPENRILVKPNFISAPIDVKPVASEAPYFIFLGRLTEEKGIYQLLKAFSDQEGVNLKIIGDGPLKSVVESFASKSNRVEYLGFKPSNEVPAYISGSIGLIFPSIWFEGFPMVILETLALKVPLFISKIVAASDIIVDHENGYLINPDSFNGSLKNIVDLKIVGNKGYQTFEEHFTKEKIMLRLENMYKKLLK